MEAVPKLAVGLPVYNGENYLEQTLTAVLAQTYGPFALVICDNASTDATPDIIKRMTSHIDWVTYVRHPENLGAAPNYNSAYELAPATEYFAWIAHDDLWEPGFLEGCVAALDANPSSPLAYARTRLVDSYGNTIGSYPLRPDLASPSAAVRLADVIDQRHPNHPVFGVARRAALELTHLHGSYSGSDRTFVAELVMLGPFVEVPEYLISMREHPQRSVRTELSKGKSRSRDVWFDSSNAGKIVMPRWRRLRHYRRAIGRAPLTASEKAAAYGELAKWIADKNWKALGIDVAVATRQVLGRLKS